MKLRASLYYLLSLDRTMTVWMLNRLLTVGFHTAKHLANFGQRKFASGAWLQKQHARPQHFFKCPGLSEDRAVKMHSSEPSVKC